MDHWRDEFHSAQSRDADDVLFDHYKCDVRLRVPLIAHFSMCVPYGLVIPATLMTLRYILHLLNTCMVRDLYPRA